MQTIEKTESEIIRLEFEFARALDRVWRPGREYSLSDFIRPSQPNGFEYEATVAGQTNLREPQWPRSAGLTQSDGSVTWTARAPSTNSRDTIQSVAAQNPSGITFGTPTFTGTLVEVLVSGGTYSGDDHPTCYLCSVEVTTDQGELIEEKFRILINGE